MARAPTSHAALDAAADAMRVTFRPIADLVPYAKNARTHSPEQVASIKASIREFGWTNPILADAKGVVAGHGRLLAASALYAEGEAIKAVGGAVFPAGAVPVLDCSGWTAVKRRAYILADNRLAEMAGWDGALLAEELAALAESGFALDLAGFTDKAFASILAANKGPGLTDEDDVPEPEAVVLSQPGDVWVLGDHRLICGDSTDPVTVAALLGNEKPHLMVTDPPYGVEYEPGWREKAGVSGAGGAKGKVLNDDRADWRQAWELFPGDVAYVWHAGLYAGVVAESLQATGFKLRSQIMWDKGQLVLSRGDYHWQHEPCWYAVRDGKTGRFTGGRKQTTVWQIPKPSKSETGHGTQKPVECMKRPIENNSEPGDAIYEPFSGSGTTIIAGEMTSRRVFAIELSPTYVDVAVRRWEAFTGKTAVRLADGISFAEVAARRATAPAPQKAKRK